MKRIFRPRWRVHLHFEDDHGNVIRSDTPREFFLLKDARRAYLQLYDDHRYSPIGGHPYVTITRLD